MTDNSRVSSTSSINVDNVIRKRPEASQDTRRDLGDSADKFSGLRQFGSNEVLAIMPNFEPARLLERSTQNVRLRRHAAATRPVPSRSSVAGSGVAATSSN